jgi:hypothetical protein
VHAVTQADTTNSAGPQTPSREPPEILALSATLEEDHPIATSPHAARKSVGPTVSPTQLFLMVFFRASASATITGVPWHLKTPPPACHVVLFRSTYFFLFFSELVLDCIARIVLPVLDP